MGLSLAGLFAAMIIGNDVYVAINDPLIATDRAIIGSILVAAMSVLLIVPMILLFCRKFRALLNIFGIGRATLALLLSIASGLSAMLEPRHGMVFLSMASFWLFSLIAIVAIAWITKPKSN